MKYRVLRRPIIQSELRIAANDEPVLSERAPGNALLGVGTRGHISKRGPWLCLDSRIVT
jgi:hypothetical protein